MSQKFIGMLCGIIALFLGLLHGVSGQSYDNATKLFDDKLGSNSGYNNKVRPLHDQSKIITVNVTFSLVAITELDERTQKFLINGFLSVHWLDELVAWDPKDYANISKMLPDPLDIWRPRMIIQNTMADRDLFEDDYCPLTVTSDGFVSWFPGSLFPSLCDMNLEVFPFDEQICSVTVMAMGWSIDEMAFIPSTGETSLQHYVMNGEWEIISLPVVTPGIVGLPSYRLDFHLKRRPGFYIMNIILPVVLMSFLNIMVFLIPVESGEKVSYGITVLLAMAVFVSIISSMLPRSSNVIPLVTAYLLALLILSVGTVLMAIVNVWLHFKSEDENKRLKSKSSFKKLFKKVNFLNRATAPLNTTSDGLNSKKRTQDEEKEEPKVTTLLDNLRTMRKTNALSDSEGLAQPAVWEEESACGKNRYEAISRDIDRICFVVFLALWAIITLVFMSLIAS